MTICTYLNSNNRNEKLLTTIYKGLTNIQTNEAFSVQFKVSVHLNQLSIHLSITCLASIITCWHVSLTVLQLTEPKPCQVQQGTFHTCFEPYSYFRHILFLEKRISGQRSTIDLCLEMDYSWPILCGAEIHVGFGPHYHSQQVSVQIRKKKPQLGSQEDT